MPLVSLLLGATALGWIGGFFWYVGQIPAEDEPIASAAETTDGIVVLTGGSERVAAGLALLREGAAKRLPANRRTCRIEPCRHSQRRGRRGA